MKKINEQASCPPATYDLEVNTKNRDATIKEYNYGPLNVDEPGDYWKKIARYWETTEEAAKKSLCENCVAFDISERMKDCMPGETSDEDGELGYCWMHHFKCHSARSCHTWAKGGPIVDDEKSLDWQERANLKEGKKLGTFKEFFTESLWKNINAKKKRGGKSARKGSKAYNAAKKAGNKLNKTKHSDEEDAESSPGRVKRAGASCKGSVTELRKRAKKYGGEKGKMYHWCANMKGGKKKRSEGEEDAEKKVSKTRAKCQAKAKRKYDVWPSAYASGYVQKCVNRGGNIK